MKCRAYNFFNFIKTSWRQLLKTENNIIRFYSKGLQKESRRLIKILVVLGIASKELFMRKIMMSRLKRILDAMDMDTLTKGRYVQLLVNLVVIHL